MQADYFTSLTAAAQALGDLRAFAAHGAAPQRQQAQPETDSGARCRLAQEVGCLEYAAHQDREALAVLRNHRITPNEKYWLVESEWHGLPCIVECEIDEATGDGWDEPRYDAMAAAMWVWIAGVRIDSGHFTSMQRDIWEEQALEALKQGAEV